MEEQNVTESIDIKEESNVNNDPEIRNIIITPKLKQVRTST